MKFSSSPMVQERMQTNLRWISIEGFSQLSCREDLNLFLGNIKCDFIDPWLDEKLFPSGRWLLGLSSKKDMELIFEKIDRNNLKYKAKKVVKPVNSTGYHASRFGISQNTVRLRNVATGIGAEELLYHFHDFELKINSFGIKNSHSINLWPPDSVFVHFKSSREAARAVLQNNYSVVAGKSIQMIHYNL